MGDFLFVGSCSGNFYALDRQTGRLQWSYNIKQDGDQTSFHGDPLVTGDLILIGADNGKQGHIYAFERESGKVRWKSLAPAGADGNVGVASDLVRRDDNIYAVAQGDELLCLSIKDGSTRWTFASQFDRQKAILSNPPALDGNVVLMAGLDGFFYGLQADSGKVGPSLLVTAALPYLTASGGNIVNVSSTFGHKAAAALSHYAASKAALEHMTRCWALELANRRIRVNAVAAGPTETGFLRERMGLTDEQAESVKAQERSRIPLGRRGLPEEVATWIVELASDSGAWITGQVITVDGGLSIT